MSCQHSLTGRAGVLFDGESRSGWVEQDPGSPVAGSLDIASAEQLRTSTRLAYVVLAHSDPALFGRLMRRLDDPRTASFVHIDAKAPIAPFRREVSDLDRVRFVEPRVKVMWAGFSVIESTIRALEAALAETSEACGHFVVISGADYPIASNDEILSFFAAHSGRQFIRRFDVADSGDARQVWRLRGRHFREWADRFTFQRKPLYALEQSLHLFPRALPVGIRFAIGSQWIAITRECAKFCVDRARSDVALVRFFRPVFAPDEIFLHTLVENSHFAESADPIEPYVDITRIGGPFYYGNVHALVPKVPVRTAEEARSIVEERGQKLFTRKFSSACSQEALDFLDRAAGA